jgi:hypothetical protein
VWENLHHKRRIWERRFIINRGQSMSINKENLPKKMWQSLAVSGQFGMTGKRRHYLRCSRQEINKSLEDSQQ